MCYELSGDLKKAESTFRSCIAMQEEKIPDSGMLGITESNLALLLFSLSKQSEAADWAGKALTITLAKNPDSPQEASVRCNLGLIQLGVGDLGQAEENLKRAAGMLERFAPDSVPLALALENEGVLAVQKKAISRAKAFFGRALSIVDDNRRSVISPEERIHLQEATNILPRFYSRALAEEGDLSGAFLTIEASRGRAMADLMAERSVDFAEGAPRDLVTQERRIADELGGTKKQFADLAVAIEAAKKNQSATEVTKLGTSLSALRLKSQDQLEQHRQIEHQIRAASPKFAALKYPDPLTKAEIEAALAPGDLVVAFNTMADVTQILTYAKGQAPEIKVTTVNLPLEKLRSLAIEFRQAIVNQTDAIQSGTELYRALIEPIRGQISNCKHLMFMPDIGLNELPFCAIPIGGKRTLSDLAPISYELSVSLYRDLVKMPHAESGFVGVAFPTEESKTHPLDKSGELFRLTRAARCQMRVMRSRRLPRSFPRASSFWTSRLRWRTSCPRSRT